MILRYIAMAALAAAFMTTTAYGDQEASNWTHVETDLWGRCYARSAPTGDYGNDGVTEVFVVGGPNEPDTKVATYDFYSLSLYLNCNVPGDDGTLGVAMAGLGPWARGHEPDDKTVGLALFYGGEEVARYSTPDIAGDDPNAVSCSVSHYQVLGPIDGYARDSDDRTVFSATTVDGRVLTFDAVTGALLNTVPGEPSELGIGACFY